MATISSTISLVDNMSSKLNAIKTNAEGVISSLEGIGTTVDNNQKKLNAANWTAFNKKCEEAGKKITDVGNKMTLAITTPLLLLGKKMYGTATDYETAFAGMTKTVEGTVEQYEHLNQVALELAENSPTGYVDLMGTMQTAGNLGVGIDQMEDFVTSYTALQAATDKHINGESGAKEVADFLNITDKGVQNIERFGSAIVHLGNNFNATEDGILSMGKRMASAASLAGFSTPQILGMATAFSAVGINAEAGGSAASKLIKQFQLAVEVGSKAQSTFSGQYGSATDFSYHISNKENLLGVAQEMGVTTNYVKSLADSWLSLEQFSQVSKKTAEQFIADWAGNPAQGLIDFFAGLNGIDASGVESTLAMLDKMGITEIRESNLVAAIATNPELFASAISEAVAAYAANTAMWAEYEKQTSTQEAQNQMLANKAQNTMADFGDNLVEAIQPVLDMVNGILDAFNRLSEVDQTRIIKVLMALAITGPSLTAIGNTVTAIGKISSGIEKIVTNAPAWGEKLLTFFTSPAGWVTMGAVALAGLVAYLESIPTTAEQIQTNLKDIQIVVDNDSVNETLAAIQKVKEASDALAGGTVTEEYENTSAAVQRGYGTNTMYGSALAYEGMKVNTEIDKIVSDYTSQIREAESKIANASTDAEAQMWLDTVNSLENQMNDEVTAARERYSSAISALFNGMAQKYPEAAQALERIAGQYDLMAAMQRVEDFDIWDMSIPDNWSKMTKEQQEAWDDNWENQRSAVISDVMRIATELSYLNMTYEEAMAAIGNLNDEKNYRYSNMTSGLWSKVLTDMQEGVQTISGNPLLAGFLQSIISDPSVTENLDFTSLNGALEGIVKGLDFDQAIVNAEDANNFGNNLVQGLADGVTQAAELIAPPFTTIRDNALTALQTAFSMHSPSQLMVAEGIHIPEGLVLGIHAGNPIVATAMSVLALSNIAVLKEIINQQTGYGIGCQISMGLASGIRSGQNAIISAARAVAMAAISAARNTLGIHSPSTVFAGFGAMSDEGYIRGINKRKNKVQQTIGRLLGIKYNGNMAGFWGNVDLFNGIESAQFRNDDAEVKISDAEMKKIRELAEREIINQFTTAELHIDFTANNKIDSRLDLDGVVSYLETKVAERLGEVAEGVYQ